MCGSGCRKKLHRKRSPKKGQKLRPAIAPGRRERQVLTRSNRECVKEYAGIYRRGMEQLPKNVRQRLNTAVERAAHPEADLLTAFAEGSLTEPERGGLLKHLAECANCRDVLYLSNPKADSSGGILVVTGKARLLSWPVLRWGALSACAVIVATAVSLGLDRQGGPVAEAPRPAAQGALQDRANRERQTYHTQESNKLAAKIEPETAAPGKIVPRVSANKKKDFDSSGPAPAVLHAEVGTAVPSKNKRDE